MKLGSDPYYSSDLISAEASGMTYMMNMPCSGA